MASTTRALLLSLKPTHTLPFLSPPRHLTPSATTPRRRAAVIAALRGGGVGGSGGLSDVRQSEFSREFDVVATMLKRIPPMDTGDIAKGVSDTAKDSMKQTISTMLGLIPSDQFCVSIRVSDIPFHRLLVSSIITGYTLWNAEYRVSLTRNFELSWNCSKVRNLSEKSEANECGVGVPSSDVGVDIIQQITSDSLNGLSPEVLSYIQQLEAELCSAKQELDAQKVSKEMGSSDNNLLEYLRSLESFMVSELSQPSSVEVKEVIHELVENTVQRVFKDGVTSEPIENMLVGSIGEQVGGNETFTISRDYLAKLLFWCMLLGHHLRGLENRLHLSCVVGLL